MEQAELDALLHRARQQDAEAFSALVDAYSPRVYGLLFQLTHSRDVADDLLQETFLRVVRMIGEYQECGRFEAWLFRIAANLARDRARQGIRRGNTANLDAVTDDPRYGARFADPADLPDEVISRREAAARLENGLQQLSEPEREILLLRHYSELSFREIADLLGVPLGTALARAHRALGRLREILSPAVETIEPPGNNARSDAAGPA